MYRHLRTKLHTTSRIFSPPYPVTEDVDSTPPSRKQPVPPRRDDGGRSLSEASAAEPPAA